MANVNFRLTIYQIGKAKWNKAVPDTKSGFYLGFTVWERRREWPKAMSFLGGSKGMPPWKFFEMNMCWDAVWCILRQFREMLQCLHCPRRVRMIFPI